MATYTEYKDLMQKIADIKYAAATLQWDQEVYMPSAGAAFRSRQLATLSGTYHEWFTADSTGDLLKSLSEDSNLSEEEKKNISLTLTDYEKSKKLPTAFVIEMSKTISEAYHAWMAARKDHSFKTFEPALTKMVDLKRKEADYKGFEGHPYDALMDDYEPGEKTTNIEQLFEDVKAQLLPFLDQIKKAEQINDTFMHTHYNSDKQWDYGLKLLEQMGYDFNAGRQDVSEHPFTTSFSPDDVRVTTRIDETNLNSMIWSCIHEGGHALYEQGLKSENYGLPSGEAISLGIHESQSRLWENNVGRSLAYWEKNYPELHQLFSGNLANVNVHAFYKAMNKVQPSLVRVESDELTYHLHVLIRFEIEKALIEGSLAVADVKDAWNEKYQAYLGVQASSDYDGVLQDIHWSHGSFGYFPTYSLGSFYAAQFFNQAEKDIPNLRDNIRTGDLVPLLDWLRTNIHQHGRLYQAGELCKKITGEPLNVDHFMTYARAKYGDIYNFAPVMDESSI